VTEALCLVCEREPVAATELRCAACRAWAEVAPLAARAEREAERERFLQFAREIPRGVDLEGEA
jgi:hypothetical protein